MICITGHVHNCGSLSHAASIFAVMMGSLLTLHASMHHICVVFFQGKCDCSNMYSKKQGKWSTECLCHSSCCAPCLVTNYNSVVPRPSVFTLMTLHVNPHISQFGLDVD